jgi:hypothetical protein
VPRPGSCPRWRSTLDQSWEDEIPLLGIVHHVAQQSPFLCVLRYEAIEFHIISGSDHQKTALKLTLFIVATPQLHDSLLDFFLQPRYNLRRNNPHHTTAIK